MPKLLFKLGVIAAIAVLFGLLVTNLPLRKGIDLAGGTALVYDVTIPEGRDSDEVIEDTIAVLSQRVDPGGVRNLTWRQVAGNRLEVVMAQASNQVGERRDAFEAALEALEAGNLSPGRVDQVLKAPASEQDRLMQELAGNDPGQLELLQRLAQIDAQLKQAQRRFESAQARYNEIDPADVLADRKATLAMESAYDRIFELRQDKRQAESELLARNVESDEINRALLASPEPLSGQQGQPTPREAAFASLKQNHPARVQDIQNVVDAFAAYAQVKGPLDDPNDLKALLRGSGVLEMRIAPVATPQGVDAYRSYLTQLDEKGPRFGRDQELRWFAIDNLDNFVNDPQTRDALRNFAQQMLTAEGTETYGTLADNVTSIFASMRSSGDRPGEPGFIGRAYNGQFYVLLGNTSADAMTGAGGWALTGVRQGQDSNGFPALNFNLNERGAARLGAITGPNIGRPMAVLLDGKIITAPTLQGLLSNQGQITGRFSNAELSYMIRSMQAGSLEGQLSPEPISEKTTGPQLGQDNLEAGVKAAAYALIVVAVFMLAYYLVLGAVADATLIFNMLLIMGVMVTVQATFTLPGIAGLVLTIGMAVDANVLIFERIREEVDAGSPVPLAVRLGFGKALSTILDANITTLITCLVLGYTATAEVKGFAVVLGVGILATLFTVLFASRVFIDLYLLLFKPKRLVMMPMLVPALHKFLNPTVNWVKLRHVFAPISAILLLAGLTVCILRGADMLDIEFRSGTSVVFEFSEGQAMPLGDVRDRLATAASTAIKLQNGQEASLNDAERAMADAVRPVVTEAVRRYDEQTAAAKQAYDAGLSDEKVGSSPPDFALLEEAARNSVVTVGDAVDGKHLEFSVSTLMTDADAVSGLIKAAFADQLQTTRSVDFSEAGAESVAAAGDAIQTITDQTLDASVRGVSTSTDTKAFLGGVGLVLRNLSPPATVELIETKIDRQIKQPPHEDLPPRRRQVVGVQPAGENNAQGQPLYDTVLVLAYEDGTDYLENPGALDAADGLAATEWAMVRDAMANESSLKSVTKFDAQVSGTMQQRALMAMGLSLLAVVGYIWLRFGSIRYGLAAIAALVHDVSIALGLVAISGWLATLPGADAILLSTFKIDLALVAALLTIVGYSLNDTIVVFDRIRENRGRLAHATPEIVNRSINQTISRTLLTSGTTLIAVLTLYLFGGPGVHGFAFAMLIGVLVGTYSSVAIAAPILLIGSPKPAEAPAPLTPATT